MSPIASALEQTLRRLTRRPMFLAVAVLTLGIGIGAPTTIFSVLDAVVLRPLPYPEPDGLVYLFETTPQGDDFAVSEPNFIDFERENGTFASMAAYRQDELSLVLQEGAPTRLAAARVSAGFFTTLGVHAVVGRTFDAQEAASDGEPSVALLGHALWQSAFGGDPAIVGSVVSLAGRPHEVLGVMAAGFDYPGDTQVWTPLHSHFDADRENHDLGWIGRLDPGVGRGQAESDLAAIAARLGATYPDSNDGWGVRVLGLREAVVGPDLDRRMAVLGGAVALLLLIACANVSNLLLAQGIERRGELAMRSALGASRGHLLRQLVGESLVLSLAGAAVGLLLASWALPLVQRFAPSGVARLDEAVLDTRVFVFAVLAALSSGIVFGLVPAWRALAGNLVDALRPAGRQVTTGGRLRDVLVVVEIALAMTLLLGATLVARSFVRLLDTDLGIDTEQVLAIPVSLTAARYDAAGRLGFFRQLEERLAAVPGVAGMSATNIRPIGGGSTVMGIAVVGREPHGQSGAPLADWRAVHAGLFETLGIALLRGRAIERRDHDAEERPVVISESLAAYLLPGEDPIGQRLALWENPDNVHTVVGVAQDINDTQLGSPPRRTVYFADNGHWPWMTLLVRTKGDPLALAPTLREEI